MNQTKHIFIVNPAAGSHDQTTEIASAIKALSHKRPMEYEIFITEYPRHAITLVENASARFPGRDLRFYACGGDGTLKEVAEGVSRIANAVFTHYPSGTGNDYVKLFGEAQRRFLNLEELCAGEILPVDYIESDCGVALNILSVGLDARIAHGMQKFKRVPLMRGQWPYLASTVEQVARGIARPYSIEIDGERCDGKYTLMLIGNGRHYGGGFSPVPEADITDGKLNVLLVRDVGRLTVAKVFDIYKQGRHTEIPHIITAREAREVTIFSQNDTAMEINLDGEIVLSSRIKMRIAPQKLGLIVPCGVRPVRPCVAAETREFAVV